MLMGNVGCGKTTICQYINGLDRVYHKTQSVQVMGSTIDTPGEYVENRALRKGLLVTSVDAQEILFLQDCTDPNYYFSPGQASMFGCPVNGVVTKIDLAEQVEQMEQAKYLLRLAGANKIFMVSGVTGEGMEALMQHLSLPPSNDPCISL